MQLLTGFEGIKTTVNVNGHIVDAVLSVRYEYESEMPRAGYDFDFGDAKDNAAYERRFETGELCNVYVQVSVMCEGLEGMDSLGACHVKASKFNSDLTALIQDYDMVENAKNDVVRQIMDSAQRFQKYLKAV